jgi:hypothetical protein
MEAPSNRAVRGPQTYRTPHFIVGSSRPVSVLLMEAVLWILRVRCGSKFAETYREPSDYRVAGGGGGAPISFYATGGGSSSSSSSSSSTCYCYNPEGASC